MSRFRLIFEGDLRDEDDVDGVSEQIGTLLEGLSDVRLIAVRRELCGCLICRHGNPIRESYDRQVFCRKKTRAFGALDSCPEFEEYSVVEKMQNPSLDARIDRFNKLFRQI